MSARPPVLRKHLVDRLQALSSGPKAGTGRRFSLAGVRTRALRLVGRPLRMVVVRVVDPSLQATLDQLRAEASAAQRPDPAEVEVLRAELLALSRRLDAVERTLSSL